MAERGIKGPLFQKNLFHNRSIRSDELTREQRIEYRGLYRKILAHHPKTWQGRLQARKTIRKMLYAEFGERRPNPR